MTRIFRAFFCSIIQSIVFVILLVGCSTDGSADTPSVGISPSPPPPAPISLIEEATKLLVGESNGSSGSAAVEGHQDGGTLIDIGLQDPGGSGEYSFDPSAMNFKIGETVNFSLTSETEFHTFTVNDLDIDVSVDFGETVDVSFTFTEAGTFELVCIPHFGNGMFGTVIVE